MITLRSLTPGAEKGFSRNSRSIRETKQARYWTHLGPVLVAAVIGLSGCSGSPASDTCNSNSVGGDGAASCAGGGAVSTGGNAGTGGGSTIGGTTSTGGNTATGGATSTGGDTSTGGATATGGDTSTGGATATGGDTSTGGATATGGDTSTGGATATGGDTSTGGATATGGDTSTGGATATGGDTSTGGAATGGESATGGAATGGESATGGATSVSPQAILKYNFEDGSGTIATDSTPNNNNGTLTSGVVWSLSGRNGNAVSFATTDSSIAMPNGLLTSAHALTVSAWVRLTASAAENRLFYFGTDTTHLTLVLNNSASPAGISLRYQGPTGGEVVLTTPTQLPTGVWKHVAVTLSGTGAAIFIDGKIVAQDNTLAIDPSTLGATTTNLVGSSPTAQVFAGLIDEFYVYNYATPLSEIRQLAWPKTDYSVYHLDEGTGTATADSSDRHIDGTLTGGATWVASPLGMGVKLTNDPATVPAIQYVTLPDGIISNCVTSITVSAWINLTTNGTNAPVFEFGGSLDDIHYATMTTYATGTGPVLSFYWINGTKFFNARQTSAIYALGQWTHIAAVRGANTNGAGRYEAVYQDGQMKYSTPLASDTKTSAGFANPTPLSFLGKSHFATVPGFNGAIDEVLVSCRQYTDDEIKQLAYKP